MAFQYDYLSIFLFDFAVFFGGLVAFLQPSLMFSPLNFQWTSGDLKLGFLQGFLSVPLLGLALNILCLVVAFL